MSMSSGGGVDAVSTLNKQQRGVNKVLGQLIKSGLTTGASDLGIPMISEEQKTAFADITKNYEAFLKGFETSGVMDALKALLSGEASFDVDSEISQEYFEKEVATPLRKDFATYIGDTVNRAYKGFTSRRGRKVAELYGDLTDTLAGKLSELKYNNMLLKAQLSESAADRQATGLGLAGSILGLPFAMSQEYLNAATNMQNLKLSEASYGLPENNPWLSPALNYLGINTMQVVEKPAEMTGLGQGLLTATALSNLFSTGAGSSFSSGATNFLNLFGKSSSGSGGTTVGTLGIK